VSISDLDESLKAWVISQRQSYMLGELSKEEIEMLISIGFDWAFGQRIFLVYHAKNEHSGDVVIDYLPILKKWYNEHTSNPYPIEEKKAQLASATGRTCKQICR
jgi:hypothetical protein